MIRLLFGFLALTTSCFAGGGSEALVAEMNGWTLTLRSAGGSSAFIEKRVGDRQLNAQIKFHQFWDYFLVAKTLPRTTGNGKSPFRMVEEDDQKRVTYLAVESARPLFELMLLNHRTEFSSNDAELIEVELNQNPPVDRKLLPNQNFVFQVSARRSTEE